MISDEKIPYGLLGGQLSHSYSPAIHAMLGDYEYELFELDSSQAEDFILNGDYRGLNVTIPHKVLAKELCTSLSATAQRTGSVNTILKSDAGICGYNTDYDGFRKMLFTKGVFVNSKKALILGSGGAARTVRTVLEDMGAAEIVNITRNGRDNYKNIPIHADAQIIVNATPVGMYPDILECPCDLAGFPQLTFVADLIYNPYRTLLLQQAEDLGINCCNGLLMLANQAISSSTLFTGNAFPVGTDEKIKDSMLKKMRNIAIIGMPGSGKSTLATALAKTLGREMLDTDKIVEQNEGKSVREIFSENGEEYFRRCEEKAVMYALNRGSSVIATGGGAVLSRQNRAVIRANSVAFYLDAPVTQLDRTDRPLSFSEEEVAAMYRKRLPLYTRVADITVKRDNNQQLNIDFILEALK